MAKDTKERILAAALDMFSQNGYAGTNIRELASSLGLVKSAVYRHFGSKEEIWNALLDEMVAYYTARFGSPERLPPIPDSPEALLSMTMRMVDFTVRDERIVKTRKVLSIEQYRDGRARGDEVPLDDAAEQGAERLLVVLDFGERGEEDVFGGVGERLHGGGGDLLCLRVESERAGREVGREEQLVDLVEELREGEGRALVEAERREPAQVGGA